MHLPPLSIDFSVDDDRWNTLSGAIDTIERGVRIAYQNATKTIPISASPSTPAVEISVVLCDDGDIQILNRDYRGKDSPTNVLSFALMDGNDATDHMPVVDGMPHMLGDVIMAMDTIEREAQQQNKPFLSHLCHLSIHGTLHLLGYDHINDADATAMETLEIELLKQLGIKDPYMPIDEPD